MKIAVIGTGNVAGYIINGLVSEGYDIRVGARRTDSESANKLRAKHNGLNIVSYVEAVDYADLIVLPIPGIAIVDAIKEIGVEKFSGKILWDITNALSDEAPVNGIIKLISTPDESLAERIQKLLPNTKVVKAMNSMSATLMYKPSLKEVGTVFLAGNDDDAKKAVGAIAQKFGWNIHDSGKIESSRALEYMGQLVIGYGITSGSWVHTLKFVE